MTNRRRFLSILGIGTVSAPLAAKEMLDKSIGDLVIRGDDAAALAPSSALGDRLHDDREEWRERVERAAQYLRAGNPIPDGVDRKMRENASYVSALDPDIACKRSWSMCVKIAAQRERQYERAKERMINGNASHKAKKAVEEFLGFKWP